MHCAIVQPSYIPWRGYFDLIRRADVFVFFDDVQYTKRSWRSRNRIRGAQGPQWLSVPVRARGSIVDARRIDEIEIDWTTAWNRSHRDRVHLAYRRAPHYRRLVPLLDELWATEARLLADFTIDATRALAAALGLGETTFVRASALAVEGDGTERVLRLLQRVGATRLINGPTARAYTDEPLLHGHGIELEYMTYDYPPYPQLDEPFDPNLSVIDLLAMTGPDAARYLRNADG